MSNNLVTSVYRFVIDDVITNVRRDFEDMGVDETILHELQRSWETKIAQTRVTNFQASDNVPPTESYAYEEQPYEAQAATTTTAAAAPASTTTNTYNYQAEQTAAANLASMASSGSAQGNANRTGESTTTNGTSVNNNSNNIPQTDGASDVLSQQTLSKMSTEELDRLLEQKFAAARAEEESQADGEGSTFILTPIDPEVRKARFLELQQRIGQFDGDAADEDDTGLGSDLDDSDGDVDEETDNIVLCQYDKVSRTKSKWKCVLKDGIMLINGRDFLFHKANGDLEW
ncbi:transcription factor IIA subunit alpha [Actinomortierella wolfii]|nr:transcription factor IIA subunit alpha [Actinomortierella wolfii]